MDAPNSRAGRGRFNQNIRGSRVKPQPLRLWCIRNGRKPDVKRQPDSCQSPRPAQGRRGRHRRRAGGTDGRPRRQQVDQDRHVDDSFRPGRAARHFLAQRGDDRSGEDQRRRRPRRAADRDGHPRFEGAAAGSGTAGARAHQHRRLRDFDRCGGLVGRLRRARGGARPRHAVPAHQLGNQRTDRRSEAAPAERVPHLPPGRPRFRSSAAPMPPTSPRPRICRRG